MILISINFKTFLSMTIYMYWQQTWNMQIHNFTLEMKKDTVKLYRKSLEYLCIKQEEL